MAIASSQSHQESFQYLDNSSSTQGRVIAASQALNRVTDLSSSAGVAFIDLSASSSTADDATLLATLTFSWAPASLNVFKTLHRRRMWVDVSGMGCFHQAADVEGSSRDGIGADLLILPAVEKTRFTLREKNSSLVFASFDRFVVELQEMIACGSAIRKINVTGDYDQRGSMVIAQQLTVTVQ